MFEARSLARMGVLAVAALLSALVIGSSIVRFTGARRAAAAVAIVEGDRLVHLGHEALRRSNRDGTDPNHALAELRRQEPRLRYIGVGHLPDPSRPHDGEAVASGRGPRGGLPRFVGNLVVIDAGRPRWGGPDGPPRGEPSRPPGAPSELHLEFEAPEANAIVSAGGVDLGIGLAGGIGLLGLAIGLFILDNRRQRAERAALEQQHLAHLGELSAVMAHEIRNPLASLKGHAQLVQEEVRGQPSQPSADRVVNAAERLEALVNHLLDFAGSGTVSVQDVDPVEVAHDAIHRVDPDRITLDADDAPERWTLDPRAIGRVLDNVLRNAIQASPEGQPVHLSVAASGPLLEIAVRDRGDGIDPEVLDRILEPFVTTRVHGTGLGLAVARRLVEEHGGTLQAQNLEEGGACFTLRIPAA
ncbi:MAG: PAS domain-containing sensor histidine kinase [Myxococcota bacterium]